MGVLGSPRGESSGVPLGGPLGSLGGPLGSLEELWEGPLGSFGGSQEWVACRDEILEILGGSQQATHRQPIPLDGYISKGILMFAGPQKPTKGGRVSPSIGWWGYVRGVWASPKRLSKAKSAENERRHEAGIRDLTRPGPKARRVH